MRIINRLAKIVAGSDGVEKHVFVRCVQEALCVARSSGMAECGRRGCKQWHMGGGGCFQEGCDHPTDDVG